MKAKLTIGQVEYDLKPVSVETMRTRHDGDQMKLHALVIDERSFVLVRSPCAGMLETLTPWIDGVTQQFAAAMRPLAQWNGTTWQFVKAYEPTVLALLKLFYADYAIKRV